MSLRHSWVGATPAPRSRQHGVVLFIALIVMVAMSLAAIALVRSVDTTSIAIGNLAFRQASILPANWAVESAAAAVKSVANASNAPLVTNPNADLPAQNYYATHNQAWDDQYGVPLPLQTHGTAALLALPPLQYDPKDTHSTVTYVIERMCNPNAVTIPADHSAAASWCDMLSPKPASGDTINDPNSGSQLPTYPFYRVTVRVDGPQNTVSFVQAMLR
jgi:type IV pilus assembly protein PilX